MRDTRNPLFVFIASLFTFGIYTVYWHFQITREIRSFGGELPTAWLQFLPLVNLYFFYRFIDEGVKVLPTLHHSLAHVVFHVFFPFFSAPIIQHRVNEYYDQEVETNHGSVHLEEIVDIVDDALDRGQEQEMVTRKLRDRGVSDHYIKEAYRIENKRNGYF
jgi:hypothetical protein